MSKQVNLVLTEQALASLRESDFDTASAVGEVIDNSLQANATTIRIQTKEQELPPVGRRPAGTTRIIELAFGDDGHGMDQETLHRCLQVGFSTRYNDRSGIGRFGVGATLGAISQCTHIDVFSKARDSKGWLYTYINLHEAKSSPYIAIPVKKVLPKEYQQLTGREQGTLVVWRNCDRVGGSREDLEHWIARTYRKFIGAQLVEGDRIIKNPNVRVIYFNNKRLDAFDPLYAVKSSIFPAGKSAKLLEPMYLNVPIPSDVPVKERTSRVTIHMTLLPEEWRSEGGGASGQSDVAKRLRISENEGFSVLRANREVFYDTMTHFEPRPHSDGIDRWWSAEICFEPALDSLFSVKNVKRGARFVRELREQIQKAMRATILEARREVKRVFDADRKKQTFDGTDVSTAHTEAEKIVKTVAPPPGRAGKGKSEAEKKREIEDILKPIIQSENELAAWTAKIESQPCTIVDSDDKAWKGSTFFDIHPQGGRTIIEYNRGHEFFLFVYGVIKELETPPHTSAPETPAPNVIALARSLKIALDLLFMAYAQAKAQFDDDQQQRTGDTLRFLETNWGLFLTDYVKNRDKKG